MPRSHSFYDPERITPAIASSMPIVSLMFILSLKMRMDITSVTTSVSGVIMNMYFPTSVVFRGRDRRTRPSRNRDRLAIM